MLENSDIVYIACWGGSTCLFLQYLLQAYTVFTRKTSKIFILTITGLCLCYLESCLTMVSVVIRSLTKVTHSGIGDMNSLALWYMIYIPINISWFLMVQVVTWLYVLRIKSLGYYTKIDSYMKYAPLIVAVMQMPNLIINLARLNIEDVVDKQYHYFEISSSVFSVCITLVEIAMFLILLKKLNFILEYKPNVLNKMGHHLKVTCSAVIFMDIVMAGVRFLFLIDFSISPLIYLLRIYIIIQFYSDLLVSVNREYASTFELKVPSYLQDSTAELNST